MKKSSIHDLTGEDLVKALGVNNDTGVSPENLAKIVEAHRADIWSDPIDAEEYLRQIEAGERPWQK